jgi:DNA-binding response OmpR family regulator
MDRGKMSERILIVDDDSDTLRLVGIMLQRQGYQTIAAHNGVVGVEKAVQEKPDLILLDVMMPDMDGYEVTRQLRKNPLTSQIPILMFTAKTQLDDKVAGFEVGADDYLTKPTHPTELQSHVKALLARSNAKKTGEIKLPNTGNGYILGVISARGGVGSSTIATNLASALQSRTQANDVILAELTPGNGTIASTLGFPNQTGLSEILQTLASEITQEKVNKALVKHASGLNLLLASENPRDVNLTTQVNNFQILVSHLASLARFVVLDLGSGLPTYAQTLLANSNQAVVILEATANSAQHTKLLIDELLALKIKQDAITLIVNNRQRVEGQLTATKLQEKLSHPILYSIAPAPEVFAQAARLKTSVVISQPNDNASQQFIKVAEAIIKREKER